MTSNLGNQTLSRHKRVSSSGNRSFRVKEPSERGV